MSVNLASFLFFSTLISFFTMGKLQISILPSIMDIISLYCLLILVNSCHHSDGFFKNFLSSKFWTPISKMSLSIYLISAYIQFGINERQLEPLEVKNELHFVSILISFRQTNPSGTILSLLWHLVDVQNIFCYTT